ncbi:MAG: lactaldehyde reductase [Erysipelotrichaceae bacterium]|nr:lactaldehyde reductase [Erysipelotrichaceae bacterium]
MSKRIILNETSYHGKGALENLPNEVISRGFKKGFVVTDKGLVEHKIIDKVTDLLKANNLDYELFYDIDPNPSIENVLNGLKALKESNADYIVAVGGGSPQDAAKAMGIIYTNPEFEDVVSLEGTAATKNPALPIIAVATTAGTASETTINYVITDLEKKRKFVCVDPHSLPVVAIIDSDMMSSLPKGLIASTGMDALTHAIEGYITLGAWELTDTFNLKSIEIIARSLRDSYAGDEKGREDMALAQYMTGMGFSNVGLGVVHGMAHPLSSFYGIAHGVANAVLLPYVMEFNADYTGEKYRDIAKVMGVTETETMEIEEARKSAIDAVKKLSKDVNIPLTLKDIGVKEEDIEALADLAMADACTPGNPRPCSKAEVIEVFKKAYFG